MKHLEWVYPYAERKQRGDRVARGVVHLTSKHEALSSDSSTSRKKRERKASTLLVARGQGKKRRVVTASMGVVFPMEIMKMSQIQRTGCCTELLA
jgi:hypothetical protein